MKNTLQVLSSKILVVLMLLALSTTLMVTKVKADSLTIKTATVTTDRPGQVFDLTLTFTTTSLVSDAERIEVEFCDSPLNVCAVTKTPTIPAASTVAQSGWNSATAFGAYARQNGDDGGTNNQISVSRTSATSEASVSGATISFTGLTNNAAANSTYYIRVRIYDDSAAGSLAWDGNTAQSTSQTLTITASVPENLSFCVGSTAVDDATTSVAADCSTLTGTNVSLGLVGSSAVMVSPVGTSTGGDNENGVAMIRTNAANGAVIDYKSVQYNSSGKLKQVSATCSGTSNSDLCFNSVGTAQAALVAGTENFGMTAAGVNCGSVASYTCTFASGTYNLVRDTQYDGIGSNVYTAGGTNGFAWDDTGAADRIASSSASAVKQLDDEALILKFAATASALTPSGSYSAQADFIATPTF